MTYSAYPVTEPFNTGRLKVSDLHEIYYEEVGNPKGSPILFVHGGPGGGIDADHRTFYDPKHYRIVLFDQRGCGKSTPHAELKDNTTWHLIDDIEKLRGHLGIEHWIVFGGSWGSTLSLIYAETHPERVKGLVLRGIFLCRKQEIDWFYQNGANHIFPEAWEPYWNHIPAEERHDMVSAYYRRLTSPDPKVRLAAARPWSIWEGSTSYHLPKKENLDHFEGDDFALAFARIECHYFINRVWLKHDNQILEDIHKIRHIPTEIVHGRYDVVCPVENAWDLKCAFPESILHITPDAGHAAREPGNLSMLIEITERFKTL